MKDNDINININPSEKKEPIYTQISKWVVSTIANTQWSKIFKVYFVLFFFLATSLIAFYTYRIISNEKFIERTSDMIINDSSTKEEEDLRDFVVTPKVQHDITALMYSLDADRVFIFELHNGKTNISGLPFRYADMSYEIANREAGVDRCFRHYQDVPLNMYSFPNYLYKHKFFFGMADEIAKIDYDFAKSLKEDGGDVVAMVYLNGTEEPIGFLGISFHRDTNIPDEKLIEDKLKETGRTISELLDLKVQVKKLKN